jgi:hypothetical protein
MCNAKPMTDQFREALRFWAGLHAASEPDVNDPVAMPVSETEYRSDEEMAMDDSVSTFAGATNFAVPAPRPMTATAGSVVELGPHTQLGGNQTTPSVRNFGVHLNTVFDKEDLWRLMASPSLDTLAPIVLEIVKGQNAERTGPREERIAASQCEAARQRTIMMQTVKELVDQPSPRVTADTSVPFGGRFVVSFPNGTLLALLGQLVTVSDRVVGVGNAVQAPVPIGDDTVTTTPPPSTTGSTEAGTPERTGKRKRAEESEPVLFREQRNGRFAQDGACPRGTVVPPPSPRRSAVNSGPSDGS